uniref:Uncharacterized protein n=1 Tax=Prolemur simus TaxID=1328070 RepID=A0A8C8YFA2_PROSS
MPSGLVAFSSQTLTGAGSTVKFFLSEAFLGQHFQVVELEGAEPESGDLFLFELMSPKGRECGPHVGVYCGQGEVIHVEGGCLQLKHRPKSAKRGCPAKPLPTSGCIPG